MALKPGKSTFRHPPRQQKRRHRTALSRLWHLVCEGCRVFRAFMKAVLALPPIVRTGVVAVSFLLLALGVNWSYQTFQKPTEIFFPLDRTLTKSPAQTWEQYENLFREHSTAVITPDFLAALAQIEGGGNPVARTYWRWQLTWNPLALYQPASSAVGMFQITNGTFQEAKRYCIHDHVVVEDGPWHDLQSCWFNSLYIRILPSHAVELTAALLDRRVAQILGPQRIRTVTLQQKQNLAAVIHLCGAGAGRAYAKRGLRLPPNHQCGDHHASDYLARIQALNLKFGKLAAGD